MGNAEWDIVRSFKYTNEMCERQGFELSQDGEFVIIRTPVKAHRPPYAKDVTLCRAHTFDEAGKYMQGYEQHIFEMANT